MAFIETLGQIDQSFFFFFNRKHNPFWDVVMSLFTRTETWLFFYLAIIYFIFKKYRFKAFFILIFLVLVVLVSDQFSVFIKETVQRLRPSHDPAIQDLVHTVMKKGGLYGFFSSHATNTFAVAMFTSRLFRNYRFTILIFTWALLSSYTRIYLGLHYPSDILMGMLIGCLIGFGFSWMNNYVENRFFLLRSPKLASTPLEVSESNTLIFIALFIIAMVMLVISRLQHIHFL